MDSIGTKPDPAMEAAYERLSYNQRQWLHFKFSYQDDDEAWAKLTKYEKNGVLAFLRRY